MNDKINTSLIEINLLSDLKIFSFSSSENVKKVFLYIPCFNYRKDAVKFFSNSFKTKDYAFVSFDFNELDRNEMGISNERLVRYINYILVWIKKIFPEAQIILLAESWSGIIATNVYKKYKKKIAKMVIWNLPSGDEYKKIIAPYTYEDAKKSKIKYICIKNHIYNKKITELSLPGYVEKLFDFDLLISSNIQNKHLKDSNEMFEETWNYLVNNCDHQKIFLIESKQNIIHSKYVPIFYNCWMDNISFIDGHHFLLMNLEENKKLFNEIERVVYK